MVILYTVLKSVVYYIIFTLLLKSFYKLGEIERDKYYYIEKKLYPTDKGRSPIMYRTHTYRNDFVHDDLVRLCSWFLCLKLLNLELKIYCTYTIIKNI